MAGTLYSIMSLIVGTFFLILFLCQHKPYQLSFLLLSFYPFLLYLFPKQHEKQLLAIGAGALFIISLILLIIERTNKRKKLKKVKASPPSSGSTRIY